MRVVALLVLAACAKSPPEPDRCERVARRLVPEPEKGFLETCRDRAGDPAFVRMLDCVLAIPGEIDDAKKQLAVCPDIDQLPLYFQF